MNKKCNSFNKIKKLSPKRQLFVQEYLVDLNATQAYIRAGYSPHGAGQSAKRLLNNAEIRQYISEMREERAARTEVTADNIIKAIAKIGLADPSQLYNPDGSRKPVAELTDEQRGWVGIRQADRLKALEMLSRHLGLFEKDNRAQNKLAHLSDEELNTEISEMTKRLGFRLVPLES